MKRLVNLFNLIGIYNDKLIHFIVGAIMCAVVGVFNASYGIAISVVAGILKEVYDYYDYGNYDYKDMLVTWLGGFVVFLIIIALK